MQQASNSAKNLLLFLMIFTSLFFDFKRSYRFPDLGVPLISKTYDPKELYQENPRIKQVLDTLVDGTFDDEGTGMFSA